MNKFLLGLKNATKAKGQLPTRVELLKQIANNPKDFFKTLKESDSRAVLAGRLKTGKGRVGQTVLGAKKFANTDLGKDLIVNAGGTAGSAVGGMAGGLPGALAGDNLGAIATRRGINRAYARTRAKAKLGSGASAAAITAKAKRTQKALERLERRKGAGISDQVGWGVGNAVAQATTGVPIPLRGGMVATRTVPHITKNIQNVQKGTLRPQDFIKQSVADIAKANNFKRIARRGNARERLLRRRVNKMIQTGTFSMYLMRRRIANFYRRRHYATFQSHHPISTELRYRLSMQRQQRQWEGRYTRLPNRVEFCSERGLRRRTYRYM